MKNIFTVFFLFIYLGAWGQDRSTIILKDKNDLLLIGKQTYYLEDKEGKMTIKEILKRENQSQFTLDSKEVFTHPVTKSAFWFKLTVQNKSQEDAWLEVGTTFAWYIDFYSPDSIGGYSEAHKTGTMRPEKPRYYDVINGFWLPLGKAKDTQAKTYYVRIAEEMPYEAPLRVGTIRSLSKNKSVNDYLTGGFVGMLLIMFLYNAFLYASTKYHAYGLYLVYLLAGILTVPHLSGYTLLPDVVWAHQNFFVWHPLLLYPSVGLFCIYYLRLNVLLPWVKNVILFELVIIVIIIPILNIFFFSLVSIGTIAQICVVGLNITCLSASYYLVFTGNKFARLYALGWTIFLSSILTYLAVANGLIVYTPFTHNAIYFGVTLEVWLFSIALGDRINIFRKEKEAAQKALTMETQKNEQLIREQNKILEQQVKSRTQEIEIKNEELINANYEIKIKNEALQTTEEELRQNMEELETNQEELKTKNEQLEDAFNQLNKQNQKVNDSIRYAQRIQNAILPHENILATAFSEHFVIFKPKDVVSGDFYWYLEVENKKFLAIIDCTGHGVPGAFMSMIGNTLLYEIINTKRIFESNIVLEQLHLGVLNSLNSKDANMQDGMDIALCRIESGENGKVKVQFSGAKRPLCYFSKQKLSEVQADKKSIGQSKSSQINYTANEIILQSGDTLYMSTDGWIDSINPERKRFGSPQFKEMLLQGANLSLKAQEEVFRHILEDYEQGTEQRDDVLLVGVRV